MHIPSQHQSQSSIYDSEGYEDATEPEVGIGE
jgi:hypothetical protein